MLEYWPFSLYRSDLKLPMFTFHEKSCVIHTICISSSTVHGYFIFWLIWSVDPSTSKNGKRYDCGPSVQTWDSWVAGFSHKSTKILNNMNSNQNKAILATRTTPKNALCFDWSRPFEEIQGDNVYLLLFLTLFNLFFNIILLKNIIIIIHNISQYIPTPNFNFNFS